MTLTLKLFSRIGVVTLVTSLNSGCGTSNNTTRSAKPVGANGSLSIADMAANPKILNIPLAVSAQQIMVQLPSMPSTTHLKFPGNAMATMCQGAVRKLVGPAIPALNPGSPLPHDSIVTVTRSDDSGDAFLCFARMGQL